MLPRPGATRDIAAACAGVDPADQKSWTTPAPPAHVFGNTWYVGTCGITVLLVETNAGLVLLDGGPPEAAPLVLANIRKLGFDPRQVRWILLSHEHWDHAGALAAIQRESGARIVSGPKQAARLLSGKAAPDDPQVPFFKGHDLIPVKVAITVPDGGHHIAGGVTFTATANPAHAPGSTSWSWRECEGGRCYRVTYADSTTTPAPDDYRFSDHPARVAAVRGGLQAMGRIPCDVVLTPHPGQSAMLERLSGVRPLASATACRDYAAGGLQRFERRLATENAKAAPTK